MCEVLGVSTSGYYEYVKRLDREETEREAFNRYLDERIIFHFYDSYGTYGSPRIHKALERLDGIIVSARKVASRMSEMNLYATQPKTYLNTTDSDHNNYIYPNKLNQGFKVEAPNKVWVTDITYIYTGEGFLYLNPIMDLYSRRIISYRIDDHMRKELCVNTLKEAIALREPTEELIHHSDRGAQYSSKSYLNRLEEIGAIISMSRKANPFDNACMESFFASFKKEFLYKQIYATKAEAILGVEFYIKFYNDRRLHSSIGYLSPKEKEMSYKKDREKQLLEERKTSV